MKPTPISAGRTILAICLMATISIFLISWDQQHGQQVRPTGHDTIPKSREKKVRDLDEAIAELDKVDIDETISKAMKEVSEAMKKVDVEKMKLELEKSMKDIDFDKIHLEVENALKEVDAVKIEKEVKESLAKIDVDKMKAELEKVKQIDFSEVNAEMEKVKGKLEKLGPEIAKELDKAKVEIEKAKVELKEYKSFVEGLASDGLINKKEPYTIEHKGGKLTINGKETDAQTYNKYRSFLEKHKDFKIDKDLDDFNIDVD
jgi:hypothetical protein